MTVGQRFKVAHTAQVSWLSVHSDDELLLSGAAAAASIVLTIGSADAAV